MRARLFSLWESVRVGYWFVPSVMALGACCLSFLMIQVDMRTPDDEIGAVPWLYSGSPRRLVRPAPILHTYCYDCPRRRASTARRVASRASSAAAAAPRTAPAARRCSSVPRRSSSSVSRKSTAPLPIS